MTRIIYQIHAQLLMTVVDLKWKGPDDSKPLDTSYTPAEARATVRVATMEGMVTTLMNQVVKKAMARRVTEI